MHWTLALLLLFTCSLPVFAAPDKTTLYLDGGLFESEKVAKNGYLEFHIPAGYRAGSLRIKPADSGEIARVEVVPAQVPAQIEREILGLTDRKGILQDRLAALDKREQVFLNAAKSQSSRTPKRTKANPDPVKTVQQGTEFAVAQLEGVYAGRRKAGRELESIEKQLAALNKKTNADGYIARVWLSRKNGRLVASYIMPEWKWRPAYDFRIAAENSARLVQHALIPELPKGCAISVVPALLAVENSAAGPVTIHGNYSMVASYPLPLQKLQATGKKPVSVSFAFANDTGQPLPAGEASCFLNGEFIGKAGFNGAPQSGTAELTFGK